jgi:hypothetical protein
VVHGTVLILRARCGSRRCTGEGVVQKGRGARKYCGCPSFTVGYPGTHGFAGYDCAFYECWLYAAPSCTSLPCDYINYITCRICRSATLPSRSLALSCRINLCVTASGWTS